jgi:hypothetical protein
VPQCPSHLLCKEKELRVKVFIINNQQPTTKSEAHQQPTPNTQQPKAKRTNNQHPTPNTQHPTPKSE